MAKEFLSGATGDPINLRRRLAPQSSRGVAPAEDAFVDFRSNGGPVALTVGGVPRLVISPGGEPVRDLPGKVVIGGGPMVIGDVDPANPGLLLLLANLFGAYTKEDLGTHYRYTFSQRELTDAAQFLSLLNDNDILPRQRMLDGMVGGLSLSAAPNQNFAIEFPVAFAEYDFHGVPVQTTGVGSTPPQLTRTHVGNWVDDADIATQEIGITIDTIVGDQVTIQAKVGAASSYDESQVVTLGKVALLADQNGARVGSVAEQVRIYWPTDATLTAGDTWTFSARRAEWTPVLTPERPIASVNTLFMDDGEPIPVEGGWTVEASWGTLEAAQDTSGQQGATVERRGRMTVNVTPTRRVTDLRFQEALHNRGELPVIIEAETDEKITGAIPYRFLQVFPACRPTGTMIDVEPGGENREEVPVLSAGVPDSPYAYGGLLFDAAYTIVVETDADVLELSAT